MKNIKKLTFIFVLAGAFVLVNPIRAEDAPRQFFAIDDINSFFKAAKDTSTRQGDQLQYVIKGADLMVINRITTLNELNTRINGDTRLNANERSALTSDIQSSIDGLNSLKGVIDAETDLTKVRTDTKQIVTSFRIYQVFEPKIRLLVILNNLQAMSTNIEALIPQIQSLINTLGGQGKDVSQLNSVLADTSEQLSVINSTITADISSLSGITASSANANDVFNKVKSDLNDIVKTDFQKVRANFQEMKGLFRELIGGALPSPTATESAVPTATP